MRDLNKIFIVQDAPPEQRFQSKLLAEAANVLNLLQGGRRTVSRIGAWPDLVATKSQPQVVRASEIGVHSDKINVEDLGPPLPLLRRGLILLLVPHQQLLLRPTLEGQAEAADQNQSLESLKAAHYDVRLRMLRTRRVPVEPPRPR
jgi:hypothetical protein